MSYRAPPVRIVSKRVSEADARAEVESEQEIAAAQQEPQSGDLRKEELFVMDSLELELGYGLLPLVDESRGGDLLERISNIRRQIGSELGVVVHPVRVRDNLQIDANGYVLKLKGIEIARAELQPGRLLAMSTRPDGGEIEGTPTTEPAFGLPTFWVDRDRRTIAEMMAKGTYASILLASKDDDGTFERLEASNAEVVQEPTEQPYGVRDCAFRDPAGNMIRIQELP